MLQGLADEVWTYQQQDSFTLPKTSFINKVKHGQLVWNKWHRWYKIK